MFEREQKYVEQKIRDYCAENGLPLAEIYWSPIPFNGEWGIATSFYQLAAQEARQKGAVSTPVPLRAEEIAAGTAQALGTSPGFSHVEAVKGYLNVYFSPPEFSSRVVDEALERGADFGRGTSKGAQVMVEFSNPNTHKAFHVGHLRSAILGEAVSRILAFAGYEVVRANYPGDMGLHVIKWLWNYMNYHAGEKPEADVTRWMGDLYAEAVRRLEENPEREAEIRSLFARWDQRDPQVVDLWRTTRQWSLDGFNQLYDTLDIHFDIYYFNSEEEQPGKLVVQELIQRGIAVDERPDGPVIVRIDELLGSEKEKYRVLVVLRSDGTALYATEDLALAMHKFRDYDLERSIYVVDVRQSLHFQQVFKTLGIAGYPWAERCEHLAYEVVSLPGNVVIASREGNVVLLEDLIREATQRALQVVQEKNPDLDEGQKQEVAQAVGMGALKYPMLARESTKIAIFDWETALNFNGQAAPYIQYAHVRCNSILKRREKGEQAEGAPAGLPERRIPGHSLEPSEIELVDLLSRVPGEIQRAAQERRPLYITNLSYDIARAFTDFYNTCPVLKADPEVRDFRLRLVAATRQALSNLLNLLGIQAPDVM